jgi:hypothetical protein
VFPCRDSSRRTGPAGIWPVKNNDR